LLRDRLIHSGVFQHAASFTERIVAARSNSLLAAKRDSFKSRFNNKIPISASIVEFALHAEMK